jgi:hypothetical protein
MYLKSLGLKRMQGATSFESQMSAAFEMGSVRYWLRSPLRFGAKCEPRPR